MKLIHLSVLGVLLAPAVFAADLSPGTLGPLSNVSDYLVYKPLQAGEYKLGLDFTQALEAREDKVIQRRLNLAVGLPAQFALGFTLLDTQEYGFDHSVKAFGASAWLRANLLDVDWLRVSTSLQFQPGMSTRESRYQASQDRTSLGLDVKIQPLDYMSAAVYASYSRRQDERYQDLKLGNEAEAGLRISLGTGAAGIYGDAAQRFLETNQGRLFARTWQAGVYVGTEDFQASLFTMIPDLHRYPGTFERGYGASLTMRIGAGAQPALDPRDTPEDAIQAVNKADNATAMAGRQVEKEPEFKILETDELDEFQLLERKEKEAARHQKETAAEKAEREMREALAAEKKQQASVHQPMREKDAKQPENRDMSEDEINRYTLPDQDDLNWNGLNTK